MPIFRFTVRNNNIQRVLLHLDDVCEETLEGIGEAAARHARDAAPVDTGALRDSYMHDVTDNRHVRVGSPLEYAPFVELGTGPNYENPPDWVTNLAQRGHHVVDPWWYLDDNGEWQQGWFIRAQPHLRPAFLNHVNEYIRIFRDNLRNA